MKSVSMTMATQAIKVWLESDKGDAFDGEGQRLVQKCLAGRSCVPQVAAWSVLYGYCTVLYGYRLLYCTVQHLQIIIIILSLSLSVTPPTGSGPEPSGPAGARWLLVSSHCTNLNIKPHSTVTIHCCPHGSAGLQPICTSPLALTTPLASTITIIQLI